MLKLKNDQSGLIPLLVCILAVVVGIMYVAYSRVLRAKH